MSTKILVPLDCSASSEGVLNHLRWFAPPESTEVVLVSVAENWQFTYGMVDYRLTDLSVSIHDATKEYLENQVRRLQDEGYAASMRVADGDPALVILEYAKELHVDMIAMSTHGRAGFARWALGSVAERVIQETLVPVFLVRPHSVMPAGSAVRILVPLDGSALSEEALASALELAHRTKATLLLLHALFAPVGEGLRLLFDSQEEVDEMLEQWRTDGQAYLEEVAARVQAKGIDVKILLAEGLPDEVIENEVAREQVDMIVMSTHGRTGLRRWVYGSVANKVLHAVDCPLLLVRATGDANLIKGKRAVEARIAPKTPIRVF